MAISTAIPPSQISRGIGIRTAFERRSDGGTFIFPQRIAIFGQGNSASTISTTKTQITSALEAGTLYGFGSPVHLAAEQLFPANGDGVGTIPVTVYGLEDDGAGVAASGTITSVGASQGTDATYYVYVNNIKSAPINMVAADTPTTATAKFVAAINAITNMPVIATDNDPACTLACKWQGASGNDLYVEVVGTAYNLAFNVVQPAAGANNPDVTAALAQVGIAWESMILNCIDVADTDTLDLFSAWGEGRWGSEVHKPAVVFSGDTQTTPALAIVVPDARKTDRVNAQLVAPGSHDLPFVVAARELARIAKQANENPATDYGGLVASGLTPGLDSVQWTNTQKEQAVQGGSSTINSVDDQIKLSDTITFYHPTGDTEAAYRFVVDIVKLQNCIYNYDIVLSDPTLDGAPLIPDDQPTSNPNARKPKAIKAALDAVTDSLGMDAVLSDPETIKANTEVEISSVNPKRIDARIPVTVSGNVNIISVDLLFGFYYGGAS